MKKRPTCLFLQGGFRSNNFLNARDNGRPVLRHGCERPPACGSDAVIAPRRTGWRWRRSNAEVTFARQACEERIDGAFGQGKSVMFGEELHEPVSVRLPQPLDRGQHAELGQPLTK